ncbi:Lrp/AsnC family transcriptional regulator [uncultured Erythrobacter sp.]|uniref:Lrp/AsnC family transcriptional regulator n=1 Tax=uncultured Erythrobacter sp. TaxID=263913 RepID=UPI00261B3122|nr:Lrp/AsnC family transcriptional regulator [uncultured Erythrobacter sp.]
MLGNRAGTTSMMPVKQDFVRPTQLSNRERYIFDLDHKDRALLKALKANSRASLVSLARDIDLSRSATHDRIAKLEEIGAIKGYTVRLHREALPEVRAFFTLQFETSAAQSEQVLVIKELPNVEAVYCLSGDIDALVYCEAETVSELSDLRDQLARHDGVTAISTRQILATSQD